MLSNAHVVCRSICLNDAFAFIKFLCTSLVSMNLFFGLRCNIHPSTLSTMWHSGLINEKVIFVRHINELFTVQNEFLGNGKTDIFQSNY